MPVCPDCRKIEVKNEGSRCRSCAARKRALKLWQDPVYAANVSRGLSGAHDRGLYDEVFASEEYRKKRAEVSRRTSNRPEVKKRIKEASDRLWSDPAYRERRARGLAKAMADPEIRQRHREAVSTPEFLARNAETSRLLWQDPEYRRRSIEAHMGIQTGENNPAWRGGVSFEPYGPEFDDALKRSVRERDDCKCAVCGTPEEGGQAHDVHHKDYNKQNNDPSNLITLCKSHHAKTNGDRVYWQAHLTGIGYELYLGAC